MARLPLILWSLLLVGTTAVDVAYFRDDAGSPKTRLNITEGSGNASAWLLTYEESIEVFDSPRPVRAYRVVVRGTPTSYAALYPREAFGDDGLSVENGCYVFSNATYNVTDAKSESMRHVRYYDGVAWIGGAGSAARFDVYVDKAGASMLFFVCSGELSFSKPAPASGTLSVLVGKEDLSANVVPYALDGECYEGATHPGIEDYSNLDEPIGPLAAHYHTRGAIYHVLYGSAKFNDANVTNDTLVAGEVRFVNAGIFYGPEEMDRSTTWTISLHEPDPSRVVSTPGAKSPAQCPFACFRAATAPARCGGAAAAR